MAACRSCGAEPARGDARFCDACGVKLTASNEHAELKHVTVLFADVVGSMDIAAKVGPERVREIMSALVRIGAAAVSRLGGTMDKFTGDGLMAVFGAPIALEDHAVRAGLAALDIQAKVSELADELFERDGFTLRLRVGLNSGQVVAGEIGSPAVGYTAVGEQVGLAQRMESVAQPGTVMVSESTYRLLPQSAVVGDVAMLHIKGSDHPVAARELISIGPRSRLIEGDSQLIGRSWELNALTGILDRALDGRGGVVSVVGPPGIGKSRLAREAARAADASGASVVATFCESHTSDVPFNAVTRLLKAAIGIDGVDSAVARQRIADQFNDFGGEDRILLEDLLGVRAPEIPAPHVSADARRRRLTAMINAASLASTRPALFVVEDVHWIDDASESMLADFFAVIPQSPTMVVLTYRSEYAGVLTQTPGMATVALAPLSNSEIVRLVGDLAGHDPSLDALTTTIVSRVDGNPFFAGEIVRDLAERGLLIGRPGSYSCRLEISELTVPATLQATIAARIDRLDPAAKRTLNAAAVIGSHFDVGLLEALDVEPAIEELLRTQLVDQVRFAGHCEYAFRHPLIRSVAYDAQLKSDRAQMHRRLAVAIEGNAPDAIDENAALIAEHLESAGQIRDAYGWHMRAGAWSVSRDVRAACASWERALRIADRLPEADADTMSKRIAPRTMLCASLWRGASVAVSAHFDELRRLCDLSDDNASLAVGMYGLAAEHMHYGRFRQAAEVASELMELLESTGYPESIVGVAFLVIGIKGEEGKARDVLTLAQNVIDWADGDPAKGNLITGSPLAIALLWRAVAHWSLGRDGWRQDLTDALAMARASDPGTYAMVVALKCFGISQGALLADDAAVRELENALRIAEELTDDTAVGALLMGAGTTMLYHHDTRTRRRGRDLVEQCRGMCVDGRFFASELAAVDACIAWDTARVGDYDAALAMLRRSVDALADNGQFVNAIVAIGYLVETLLHRGASGDVAEARAAVNRMSDMPVEEDFRIRDMMVLRLRTLLARAEGSGDYPAVLCRYRDMAASLGYDGHIAWAEAM